MQVQRLRSRRTDTFAHGSLSATLTAVRPSYRDRMDYASGTAEAQTDPAAFAFMVSALRCWLVGVSDVALDGYAVSDVTPDEFIDALDIAGIVALLGWILRDPSPADPSGAA